MNRTLSLLIAAVLTAGAGHAAFAADAATPSRDAVREKLKNMTPEERAAAKEKMRAKWESMTPEEREAAKKRFAERHPDAAKKVKEKAAEKAAAAPMAAASGTN